MFGFTKSAASAFQNLTPAQFAEGLRQPGAVLLDVRRPEEFAQGHLPKAVNLEVTAPDFAQRIAILQRGRATHAGRLCTREQPARRGARLA
jgi:phage shock protein E